MKENENRIGYYSEIPATVLYNKELKPNEKLLYAIITSLTCKEGYCFASNEYLAEKLGVNRKTVSSWITHLEEKKFISNYTDQRQYPDEFFNQFYANLNKKTTQKISPSGLKRF